MSRTFAMFVVAYISGLLMFYLICSFLFVFVFLVVVCFCFFLHVLFVFVLVIVIVGFQNTKKMSAARFIFASLSCIKLCRLDLDTVITRSFLSGSIQIIV